MHISDERIKFAKCARAKDTDIVEIKAFLGLVLLAGVFHSNRMNLEDLWNSDGTRCGRFQEQQCHFSVSGLSLLASDMMTIQLALNTD